MADRVGATESGVLAGVAGADGAATLGVLLAIDDFPLLVAGYRVVIDAAPDLRVVGVVGPDARPCEQVARLAPDIVVTGCPSRTGAGSASGRTIEEIRAARPAVRILAVECRCGREQSSLAIGAGADGVLTREATAGEVLTALRRIGRGETCETPSGVTRATTTHALWSTPAADDAFDALSEPVREVFRLAAVGHSSREIARRLHLSERTVHKHRATIMQKLGLHRRVELLKYALRRGIIQATEL